VGLGRVGASLNLCHEFLRKKGNQLDATITATAPYLTLVSINGVQTTPPNYIMRLDQGDFDMAGYIKKLRTAGDQRPVGLQCYQVPGDIKENLQANISAWRRIVSEQD
jgi:hypothetical protein